jgi:hypothetical protein
VNSHPEIQNQPQITDTPKSHPNALALAAKATYYMTIFMVIKEVAK